MNLSEQIGSEGLTFIILTVGIVISVSLAVYMMTVDSVSQRRIEYTKNALTLVIAILSTVTGFYFGSRDLEGTQVRVPRQHAGRLEGDLETMRQIQRLSSEQLQIINQVLSLLDEQNTNEGPTTLSMIENIFFAFMGALLGVAIQSWTRPRLIVAAVGAVVLFGTVVLLF